MTTTTHEKHNSYKTHQNTIGAITGNSRETDSRALVSCAHRLDAARKLMETNNSKESFKIYGEAIRHNQRLWTIFQVALCDPENQLPRDLKITLLNLSRYIDKTSFRAIGKFAPEQIASLIDINRIIAIGLSKKVPAAASSGYTAPVEASEASTSVMTSV